VRPEPAFLKPLRLAQWLEGIQDPEQKIARPRQTYTDTAERTFIPIDERSTGPAVTKSA
jgi:hypothetical protein